MVELAKNVSAVLGCITACIGFIALICKPLRKIVVDFIRSKAGKSDTDKQLTEIRNMLQKHMEDDVLLKQKIQDALAITTDFTERQCRNIIKNIYYRYKGDRTLPLYEKKTLLDIEELYVKRMHKNHWGQTLLNEMKTWGTDCSDDEIEAMEEE